MSNSNKEKTKDGLEEICVYSFDPGTTQFAAAKISIKINPSDKLMYYGVDIPWVEIFQIKYKDTEGFQKKDKSKIVSEDEMIKNFYNVLTKGCLKKIDDEYRELLKHKPNRRILIMVESQVDHILDGSETKGPKPKGGPKGIKKGKKLPILYALYNVVHMYFLTKYGPERVQFIPWRGHDKSGLEDCLLQGEDRKVQTIETAINFLESEGFQKSADFIKLLYRPKPAQDVADVYNQARSFLLNFVSKLGYSTMSSSSLDHSSRIQKRIADRGITHEIKIKIKKEVGEDGEEDDDDSEIEEKKAEQDSSINAIFCKKRIPKKKDQPKNPPKKNRKRKQSSDEDDTEEAKENNTEPKKKKQRNTKDENNNNNNNGIDQQTLKKAKSFAKQPKDTEHEDVMTSILKAKRISKELEKDTKFSGKFLDKNKNPWTISKENSPKQKTVQGQVSSIKPKKKYEDDETEIIVDFGQEKEEADFGY